MEALSVQPPVAPMLAKPVRELPVGDHLVYEPKWDGFRCIVFRDGNWVELGSRNGRSLTRYFPELVEPVRQQLPASCVVDGEIVIATTGGLDFDALLQRIHPAASRVRALAAATPASFVVFDLLALGDRDLRRAPYRERRHALATVLAHLRPPLHLTPATTDPAVAADWFARFEGAGLDGVIVKDERMEYREGERAMVKVKHQRTADCVVAGFRWQRPDELVGSLLLGLYDGAGVLHHVGVTSSFTAAQRAALVGELTPLRSGIGEHPWLATTPPAGRVPGAPSRWSAGRDLRWEPLRPERVCEVAYDHLQGDRFRHAATFRRWRPERDPRSCTYAQLDVTPPAELAAVFAAR